MTITSADLHAVAERLAILTKKLKNCTDSDERRDLLREFRALLGEADSIIVAELPPKVERG